MESERAGILSEFLPIHARAAVGCQTSSITKECRVWAVDRCRDIPNCNEEETGLDDTPYN